MLWGPAERIRGQGFDLPLSRSRMGAVKEIDVHTHGEPRVAHGMFLGTRRGADQKHPAVDSHVMHLKMHCEGVTRRTL